MTKSQRSDVLKLSPCEDSTTNEEVRDWATAKVRAGHLLAIDLFSGAGGLSLGIEKAGWTVAAAVDVNERALETHRHNFCGLALNMDLGDPEIRDQFVTMWQGIPIDLVAGGPPCQPFSRAGRSKIRSLVEAGARDRCDNRKELWRAFLDIALRLSPRTILMENVPDMGLGDDFRVIRAMVDSLENAKYDTQLRLADAWRVGVPQHRQRLLLLARNDHRQFSQPAGIAQVNLETSIGDLPKLNGSQGKRELPYEEPHHPGWFIRRMRDGASAGIINDHMTRAVRDDDLLIFQMMTPDTLYSDIPANLRRYRTDSFDDKYKRLDPKGLSRSITAHIAKDGYWYIHPTENRTLTVREAARIQTFPDCFRFAGSRSDAFRQIGNAVPPLLGEAAASALNPDTPKITRPQSWIKMRERLSQWASNKAEMQWYAFPGPTMTPPAALVIAVLSKRKLNWQLVNNAAQLFRGLSYFNSSPYHAAQEALPARSAEALEVILPLMWKRRVWENLDEVARIANLEPSQRRLFRLLLGDDIMLQSQDVLRVAARVFGSHSNKTNRLTEGRLELARLIGSGHAAPKRMAAIRFIGNTLCFPTKTSCAGCPLALMCFTAPNSLSQAKQPSTKSTSPGILTTTMEAK